MIWDRYISQNCGSKAPAQQKKNLTLTGRMVDVEGEVGQGVVHAGAAAGQRQPLSQHC